LHLLGLTYDHTAGDHFSTTRRDVIVPDGCTPNAHGQIWFADRISRRFVPVETRKPGNEQLPTPDGAHVHVSMLGGSDGQALAMCWPART
jgi:hypothetical protein